VQLGIQATKQLMVLTGLLLNNAMYALFKAIAATPVGLQNERTSPEP
jgi:hypothetical protein